MPISQLAGLRGRQRDSGTRNMVVGAKGRIWYGTQPYFKAGYVRVRTEAEKALALGK